MSELFRYKVKNDVLKNIFILNYFILVVFGFIVKFVKSVFLVWNFV